MAKLTPGLHKGYMAEIKSLRSACEEALKYIDLTTDGENIHPTTLLRAALGKNYHPHNITFETTYGREICNDCGEWLLVCRWGKEWLFLCPKCLKLHLA